MKKHAKFSPSSLYRIEECPASFKHSLDIPEPPSSPYSIEGTEAHDLAERILNGEEVSEPIPEPVQRYVDHVRASVPGPWARLYVERTVDAQEDVWGTADAIIVEFGGTLKVIDLKYGQGVKVGPVNNPQCTAYLLGALKEFEATHPTKAEVHIHQPRVFTDAKVWKIDDVEQFKKDAEERIQKIKDRALADDPEFKSGEHCRFCRGKLTCPKIKSEALAMAKSGFSPLTVAVVDTEELLAFHEKAKQVEIFLKAVAEELHKRASDGEEVPGYKVVRKTGNLAWTTEEETLIKKLRNKKLKQDEFYSRKLRTPTQLKKKLGDKFIEEHAGRPDRGTVLVPETDDRPAAAIQAAEAFKELMK